MLAIRRVISAGACFAVLCSSIASIKAQNTSRPTGYRDSRAIELVDKVVKYEGGAQQWASIHSIKTQWTYTASETSTPTTLVSNDDWSSGTMVFQHSSGSGTSASSISATAANAVIAQTPGASTKSLSPLEQANYLPLYAPAAAFTLELSNPLWEFRYLGLDGTNVRIQADRLTISGSIDLSTVQDWVINPSTNLPVRVAYRDIGVQFKKLLPQSIQFASYATYGGLTVPSSILLGYPAYPALTLNTFSAE